MHSLSVFDSPIFYGKKHRYYSKGNSPRIFNFLRKWLRQNADQLEVIYVAVYLFNNEYLHDELLKLAKKGVRVHLVTIPPDGYDSSYPKMVFDKSDRKSFFNQPHSKYSLTKRIFTKHFKSEIENFELRFFPHQYLRSHRVRPFSRGRQPYSMHLKSFLFLFKNGKAAVGLSSSNFAVRDSIKEENFLLTEIDAALIPSTTLFFQILAKYAIPIREFEFKNKYHHFQFSPQKVEQNNSVFFTAPFYFNSPFQAEYFLKQYIDKAERRILVAAQHIGCYEYALDGKFHTELNNRRITKSGFLKNVLQKAKEGVRVQFISQTFSGSIGRYRRLANKGNFRTFYDALEKTPNIQYAVNEHLHSKYLIIDDLLIVTTCNFTPTQFIYLDNVNIPKFDNMPDDSYSGIFSEVGQFLKITDPKTVDNYVQNFKEIWNRKTTHQVTLNRKPTP